MNSKIKKSLLVLGLGLGLSAVAQAGGGPQPGSQWCLNLDDRCIAGDTRACGMWQNYCPIIRS